MSNKDKLIKQWILKADRDLGMAELALAYKPEYADLICFHCQQAAEKYLKAWLAHFDIVFKKTHSLAYLLDLISEKQEVSNELYSMAEQLEGYAVEVRYPEDIQEPTEEDTREACRMAVKIRNRPRQTPTLRG